jgi:hypothetical protein
MGKAAERRVEKLVEQLSGGKTVDCFFVTQLLNLLNSIT